jgi:acetyl esterase/lipase
MSASSLIFRLQLVTLLSAMCVAQQSPREPQKLPFRPSAGETGAAALTVYLPEKPSATGIVICPGGGYSHLAVEKEGIKVARFLNTLGVTAFVLEYRFGPQHRFPAPLEDISRAVRYVRSHADEFALAPNGIGVLGFSAGGHLASTLGTHFDSGDPNAVDTVERTSSRPDFMVLIYPVIKPSGNAAISSFHFLLGDEPDPALVRQLSNDLNVTANTPRTFLVHADDDRAVLPDNSVDFYSALRRAGVPAELHIYSKGGHGFGLATDDPVLFTWTVHLAQWLAAQSLTNNR